jgi:hypothetical protein
VNRNFTADVPNRLWVADATRILTGVLWPAAIRDGRLSMGGRPCTRSPTGSWVEELRPEQHQSRVLGALKHEIWSRDVRDGQVIRHSAP